MKNKVLVWTLTTVLMAAAPGLVMAETDTKTAEEDITANEAAAEEVTEEAETAASGEGAVLSEDLYSFQIQIQGEILQFPMTCSEMQEKGWEFTDKDDAQVNLGPNNYTYAELFKDDLKYYFDFANFKINEAPLSDCLVCSIEMDYMYDAEMLENIEVLLPKGIKMGTATREDIEAAYGTPSDVYESEYATRLTYEEDIYQEIELSLSAETGLLTGLDMRNMIEPEGFDKGEFVDEVPEIVSAYQAPAALGNFMEAAVEFCGDLYTLPCPASAFVENGWELKTDGTEYVGGGGFQIAEMTRDNQTVRIYLNNYVDNAVAPQNCFVEELSASEFDGGAITLKVSGGFEVGSSVEELKTMATENGYEYEEDGNNLSIRGKEPNTYQIYLYTYTSDEDPEHIASIEYKNAVLE
ncbi:MAG: hypothetical protein HUJ72_09220 [Blautia sp.]|nr:hypothetical protein [Blautia sp.]